MIRLRPHRIGKAESLFVDNLKPFSTASATRDNVGQPLANVLDSEVIAAPVVREPIESGLFRISGDLTLQQAGDFALLVRAGLLPPPLTIVEQQIVEPKVVEPR
jgi:preprotein translocase subunit SecD